MVNSFIGVDKKIKKIALYEPLNLFIFIFLLSIAGVNINWLLFLSRNV